MSGRTIADLGEDRLLERVRTVVDSPPEGLVGMGDDTAILARSAGKQLLTTDTLVENVHFRRAWCTPEEVGWKALAVNLSDIAGMGGRPVAALVSLIVPPETEVNVVLGFYRGMRPLARSSGVAILGGNLAKGSSLSLTLAVVGNVHHGTPFLRSGARAGDGLFVSGQPGLAGLGCVILERKMRGGKKAWTGPRALLLGRRTQAARAYPGGPKAIRRFLFPTPRIELAGYASALHPTAMMDLSDGLAVDLPRLARASGVGIVVDTHALPSSTSFRRLCDALGVSTLRAILEGGEDYELAMTVPAGTPVPRAWQSIGEITTGSKVLLRDENGRTRPLTERGFDHFRAG
jgi:thiamine-monophosphate kinase